MYLIKCTVNFWSFWLNLVYVLIECLSSYTKMEKFQVIFINKLCINVICVSKILCKWFVQGPR